jgi:hypothetical protein
MPYMLSS